MRAHIWRYVYAHAHNSIGARPTANVHFLYRCSGFQSADISRKSTGTVEEVKISE